MRVLFAIIIGTVCSFLLTPLGGIIVAVIVLLASSTKKIPAKKSSSFLGKVYPAPNKPVTTSKTTSTNLADELDKLHTLKMKGALTEDEYEKLKKELI